jgi:hypothetical protein
MIFCAIGITLSNVLGILKSSIEEFTGTEFDFLSFSRKRKLQYDHRM